MSGIRVATGVAGVAVLLAGCGGAPDTSSAPAESFSDSVASSGKIALSDSDLMASVKLIHNRIKFTDNGTTGLSDAHVVDVMKGVCGQLDSDTTSRRAIYKTLIYLSKDTPQFDWTASEAKTVLAASLRTVCPDLELADMASADKILKAQSN